MIRQQHSTGNRINGSITPKMYACENRMAQNTIHSGFKFLGAIKYKKVLLFYKKVIMSNVLKLGNKMKDFKPQNIPIKVKCFIVTVFLWHNIPLSNNNSYNDLQNYLHEAYIYLQPLKFKGHDP